MEKGSAGDVFNVGGGEESSMLEAIGTLEKLSGRTLELRPGSRRKGDQARTLADTSRIRDENRLAATDAVRERPRSPVALGR